MTAQPASQSGSAVRVTIATEDQSSLELTVTPELLELLDLAAFINRGTSERFNLSFSALMIGFYYGKHSISDWYRSYIAEQGADFAAILSYRQLNDKELVRRIQETELPFPSPEDEYPNGLRTATISARRWLEIASGFAREQGHDWTGLRHMMLAVIFTLDFHTEDLNRWRFDRRKWALSYLGYVARDLPGDLEFCRQISEKTWGKEPDTSSIPEEVSQNAASAHIATDSWTIDDALGHREYARAIYSFITDKKTEAPLAISIQAPWGGGKTSLMRMVQMELDPEATNKLESERQNRRDRHRAVPAKVTPGSLKEEISERAIKIRDVVKEIAAWKKASNPKSTVNNPSVPSAGRQEDSSGLEEPPKKRRITVWFNAWKYQSTEQVWAGLADCILRQVTDRMKVLDRQRFWLQLQFGRLDTEKIQRRIFERLLSEWWRTARTWIWGAIALIVFGVEALLMRADFKWVGISSSLAGVLGGLKSLQLYVKKKSEIEREPAELTLGEYLQVPDYRSKVGFIHEVAEDLNRVMNVIPPDNLPIVIFIDDLDRCTPQKVAEVTEGINLFLAGEFPDCIFVFGMDAEMVAAALEKAHSDVIAKLPAYATGIPIGWRFMDKFVQLPFVIPPPEPEDLDRYVKSLLKETAELQPLPSDVQQQVEEVYHKSGTDEVARAAAELSEQLKGRNLSDAQKREVDSRLKQAQRLAEIDAEIARASKDNEMVRTFVLKVAPDLYSNPRDLKRFLNTFRLHDFLRIAREGRSLDAPSRELIADWIRLSLRWPQMVRWMHRVAGDEDRGSPEKDKDRRSPEKKESATRHRLQQLEAIAGEVKDSNGLNNWKRLIVDRLGSNLEDMDWVSDPALFEFFREMSRRDESHRLSYGAGKGLW